MEHASLISQALSVEASELLSNLSVGRAETGSAAVVRNRNQPEREFQIGTSLVTV